MNPRTKVSKTNKAVKSLVSATFPEWKGRKVSIEVGPLTFWDTNWGGGTRNEFRGIRFEDRSGRLVLDKAEGLAVPAPWANPVEGKTVDLPPGVAVVEHSVFCGKDAGITIHIGPDNYLIAGLIEAILDR